MEDDPAFTYMRLGDGELAFLLRFQEAAAISGRKQFQVTGHGGLTIRGGPGLEPEHAPRLLQAYERCTYLDYCDRITFIAENLSKLQLHRQQSEGSQDASRSLIGYAWFYHELKKFGEGKTCLFCGAEGKLLQTLLEDDAYLQHAAHLLPTDWNPVFIHPRNKGEHLSRDLEGIKDDLREGIRKHRPDILFLALGGAAKIIGTELAEETGVRAFDTGAVLRGFTYSGTVGYAAALPAHHTYYGRIPLKTYYPALLRAHPELSLADRLRKAQGQLILECEVKKAAETCRASRGDWACLDRSATNRRNFAESYAYYRKVIRPSLPVTAETCEIAAAFESWRRNAGLLWDGRIWGPLMNAAREIKWRTLSIGSRAVKATGLNPIYQKLKKPGLSKVLRSR